MQRMLRSVRHKISLLNLELQIKTRHKTNQLKYIKDEIAFRQTFKKNTIKGTSLFYLLKKANIIGSGSNPQHLTFYAVFINTELSRCYRFPTYFSLYIS